MAQTQQTQPPVVEKKASMDDTQTRNLATLCHLGGLLGFLPPLIIWLLKKDDSPLIDDQGKEAVNFQISVLICLIPAWILSAILLFVTFLPIGFLLVWAVVIINLVMVIIAAVKTSKGEKYRYPLSLRLVK